jgi:hypothetical protein
LKEVYVRSGIITDIRNWFLNDLYRRRIIRPKDKPAVEGVSKAINVAVAQLCGVDGQPKATGNKGPLNRAAYHHALMLPHSQRTLRQMTKALLIQWRVLTDAAWVYNPPAKEQIDAA